jgi:hypothetical protein
MISELLDNQPQSKYVIRRSILEGVRIIMSEELGKIERPEASGYRTGRKLFFVPLVFMLPEADEKYQILFDRYWEGTAVHLKSLQDKITPSKKIYHELVPKDGGGALEVIQQMNAGSYQLVKKAIENGGATVAIEDAELLQEFMDWGRCLAIGLNSQKVFNLVYESYIKAQKSRNEYIAKKIDTTLGTDEAGIFIMREGHHVQFPADIQIFYVSPPELDEIRRWEREQAEKPIPREKPGEK